MSAEGRHRIAREQLQELYEQMSNCVIRAQRPGLVVYGGNDDRRNFGGEEPIREGATVRERQTILTIPDMNRMSVKVKIHESHIKKIIKGLKASVQLDAFPDQKLQGEVSKVAVLPDSGNRWMNPDMKIYPTTINIQGAREWLKPGMSAKVEILVNELTNVVYIPIQAVITQKGKHLCYVATHTGSEARDVAVGEFNDEFIEIKKGIKEGENVLLRSPVGTESENMSDDIKDEDATPAKASGTPAGDAGAAKTANRPAAQAAPVAQPAGGNADRSGKRSPRN